MNSFVPFKTALVFVERLTWPSDFGQDVAARTCGCVAMGIMRLYCFLARNRSAKPACAAHARCLHRVWPNAPFPGALGEHCRPEALEGQLYVEECLSVWIIARKHAACNRPRARLQWLMVVSHVTETFLSLSSNYHSSNGPAFSSNKSSWSLGASPCAWYLGAGRAASVYFCRFMADTV